jgi:uracil-DNA glycosylase
VALDIEKKSDEILSQILKNPHLKRVVDHSIKIPAIFKGSGPIRIIILGQNPTIKNPVDRKEITTVLNLNRNGALRSYVESICLEMGLIVDRNVYATNCLKNFFTDPPAPKKETDTIFEEFLPCWLPLLKEELSEYPDVPVITMGEPLLKPLLKPRRDYRVHQYWGYTDDWKESDERNFSFIKADDNILKRILLPFPHQPSLAKEFFRCRFKEYIRFIMELLE